MKNLSEDLKIDENCELIVEPEDNSDSYYIDSLLFLSDQSYEELYNRSKLPASTNKTFRDILNDDDCTATCYADLSKSGNITVAYLVYVGDNGYFDDNVPLLEEEKEKLLHEVVRAAAYQNTTIDDLFAETDEPEMKAPKL